MARLKRIAPEGMAQHVIQRGNNRQACFGGDSDMKTYLNWLKEFSKKYKVSIHAWVLMTNHVHLLCTPEPGGSLSKMMQSLGRMYVQYFNYTYGRSGTLWEGRFKSCLVQSERYLLELYRYVELNPVRAGMVEEPSEYSWSSYGCNALGLESELRTPHEEYLLLGATNIRRQRVYRGLFENHVSVRLIDNIRNVTNRGLALGDNRFVSEIEKLTKSRLRPGSVHNSVSKLKI